ncbi:MAG: sigma factor-like helix-turn-helix DNA-binding protein [Solirubrobacteraceae bacterium]
MSQLDRLPPDQRAVLSLVLDRGRSYGEVAEMLGLPESAVRDRAHAALDALAAEAGRPRTERATTPTGRVEPVPTGSPATESATGSRAEDVLRASAGRERPGGPGAPRRPPTGSRRAGAILLGAIVVVVIVVIVLVTTGGGNKGAGTTGTGTGTTSSNTTSSTNASSTKPKLNKTISLSSPDPELKAAGTAYVLSEGGRSAFYIAAQGLPESKGFFYAVWLYNSTSSSTPLGRASDVGPDGKMQGGNPLPSNASLYHQLIVTRETSTHPAHPGPIVLQGTFALH